MWNLFCRKLVCNRFESLCKEVIQQWKRSKSVLSIFLDPPLLLCTWYGQFLVICCFLLLQLKNIVPAVNKVIDDNLARSELSLFVTYFSCTSNFWKIRLFKMSNTCHLLSVRVIVFVLADCVSESGVFQKILSK